MKTGEEVFNDDGLHKNSCTLLTVKRVCVYSEATGEHDEPFLFFNFPYSVRRVEPHAESTKYELALRRSAQVVAI